MERAKMFDKGTFDAEKQQVNHGNINKTRYA